MRLQVERPELVDTDHHGRIVLDGLGGAVRNRVQLEDVGLLGFEQLIVRQLHDVDHLKLDALLADQNPTALVAESSTTPTATRNSASFDRLRVENGKP